MKAMNGLSSTLMSRRGVIAAASMMGLGLAAGCSSSSDSGSTTSTSTTEETEEDSNKVGQPTDFELDLETGDFTFTATDENVGYYFVRLYAVKDGVETGDQIASSERINGGSTGSMSGNIDLSGVTYGDFNANLYAYPASGTDYEIAIKKYIANGIMGSMNRVGLQWMPYGMFVTMMRDEWGYKGIFLTDSDGGSGDAYNNPQVMLASRGIMLSISLYVDDSATVAAYGDATSTPFGNNMLHYVIRDVLYSYYGAKVVDDEGNVTSGVSASSTTTSSSSSSVPVAGIVGGVVAVAAVAAVAGVALSKKKKKAAEGEGTEDKAKAKAAKDDVDDDDESQA